MGEGGGEGFVGVDTEGEGVRDEGVGEVFLLGVAFPGVGCEYGAETMADGLGGVGRAGVDDDDFVNDGREGLEAAGNVALLVLGDYNRRDGRHDNFFSFENAKIRKKNVILQNQI